MEKDALQNPETSKTAKNARLLLSEVRGSCLCCSMFYLLSRILYLCTPISVIFLSLLKFLLFVQINRKLVKQTVMTSVYGVTFVGARMQILNRLKERGTIQDQAEMYRAACYAAKVNPSLTAIFVKSVLCLYHYWLLYFNVLKAMHWFFLCALFRQRWMHWGKCSKRLVLSCTGLETVQRWSSFLFYF